MSQSKAQCQYAGDEYKPTMVARVRYSGRDKEGVEI